MSLDRAKWKLRPYRTCVGVIGYMVLGSRNECAFAFQQLARFNDNYGQDHWDALLRLISYLKKTRDTHCLVLSKFGGMSFAGYCDSDWNGNNICTSTTGWIIFFGWAPIAWVSRAQRVTARSTGEAEFLALSSLSQEAIYLQMFVKSLNIPHEVFQLYSNDSSRYAPQSETDPKFDTAVKIWSDSQVAIAQALKPDNWVVDKLRHVRFAYFFFKSYIRQSKLQLHSVSGVDNPSDIMTKGWGAPGKTAVNQKADTFQRHSDFCAGKR